MKSKQIFPTPIRATKNGIYHTECILNSTNWKLNYLYWICKTLCYTKIVQSALNQFSSRIDINQGLLNVSTAERTVNTLYLSSISFLTVGSALSFIGCVDLGRAPVINNLQVLSVFKNCINAICPEGKRVSEILLLLKSNLFKEETQCVYRFGAIQNGSCASCFNENHQIRLYSGEGSQIDWVIWDIR